MTPCRPRDPMQRELGLTRALKPYLQDDIGRVLPALPQETGLATLSLLCDFYPEDGQLTLIEQLRDVITEHIPEEERAWLDPLKHSYIDLLEVVTTPKPQESLVLRSLGDGTTVQLPYDDFAAELLPGHVLLTRVIRDLNVPTSGRAVWAGCGIVLTASDGKSLYAKTREWERRMPVSRADSVGRTTTQRIASPRRFCGMARDGSRSSGTERSISWLRLFSASRIGPVPTL